MTVPSLTLNNGTAIPQLGFGVFQVDPAETTRIVTDALEVGYRHIDTARIYRNEEGVGAALAASGIPRDELFITTKLWNGDQGRDTTQSAFDASLERLGLDYVDLYLIHWPSPKQDKYIESWEVMEQILASGRAKAIGVSNFMVPHLTRLLDATTVVPAVNQIELHPAHQQPAVTAFGREHGIVTEAWSPLGGGRYDPFSETAIAEAAEAHGKTPAQVIIRWHLQKGVVVFPKTNNRSRMVENFDVFDFELAASEIARIDALERAGRVGGDPNQVD